jgi:hypothetical protein
VEHRGDSRHEAPGAVDHGARVLDRDLPSVVVGGFAEFLEAASRSGDAGIEAVRGNEPLSELTPDAAVRLGETVLLAQGGASGLENGVIRGADGN